jgi:hypothetical protein
MSGYKLLIILFFLGSAVQADTSLRRQPISRMFFATSFGHWQHGVKITDGTTDINLSGISLALGAGLGYSASLGPLVFISQGQVLWGSSDIGYPPGGAPFGTTLTGQSLGFFGAKLDFSLLAPLGEGVAVGFGLPLISTLYFKRNLATGITLKNQDLISWGAFLDFRLRRNSTVFNPKMGFIRNLRQYFVSMDVQWHF